MSRILIIDPQFAEDPDIERQVAGDDFTFEIVRPTGEVSTDALSRADAVLNCRSRHKLPAHLVAHMNKTRIVVQAGVGFNHIDLDACASRDIPVCNTPDYGTTEVADHAIGMLLSLVRGITTHNDRLKTVDDAWSTLALPLPPVRRLKGQVFGVVGLGRIGLATARRARSFGMEIVFHDPYLPPGAELSLDFKRAATLEELLGSADIVSLHCPLTSETAALIDPAAVQMMKPGSILINTSRGGVVDLDAVEAGLRTERICAAALDVLPVEPPDRTHPLIVDWSAGAEWLDGRFILTPHAAFYSPASLADMRRLSMLGLVEYLESGRLRSCVNLRELANHGFDRTSHAPAT